MLSYVYAIGIVALIYALLTLSLDLQYGQCKLVNFGIVAFYGIGAYTSGLLATHGWPVPVSMGAGMLVAGLCALPIGLLSLRLGEEYLAIVTLGFAESVRIVLQQEEWLTRGVQGLPAIPKLFQSQEPNADLLIFFTLLVAVGAVAMASAVLAHSAFGLVLKAIGDNEAAAAALGKNPAGYKVKIFSIGAAISGLAGGFYAHFVTFISPDQFISLVTFYVWIAMIIGGIGSIRGAIAGALILQLFLEGSRFLKDYVPLISEAQMGNVRMGIIGLALVVCVMLFPKGVFGKKGA